MSREVRPSVLGGTMIVAGTAIGAGILALPTVAAGMWVFWAIAFMFISWVTTYLSSRAILEVNLHYHLGASFNSLVKNTLGEPWNTINGISYAFVLCVVLYAYVSGGSSTVDNYMVSILNMPSNTFLSGLIFSVLLISIVFIGAKSVDRVSTVMMFGLVISFVVTMSGMTFSISPVKLFDQSMDNKSIYIWMALSTFMTSFTYHNCIPSLVKYFGKSESKRVSECLLYGSLMALVCYSLWIVLIHGNIDRNTFKQIMAEDGNVGTLLKYASASGAVNVVVSRFLDVLAFFALTTSFLGVGLGLYDYLVDLLKIDDSILAGRLKVTGITFAIPVIGGLFFPSGFIAAIALAGFFCAIWALIIPGIMILKIRKEDAKDVGYTAYKSNFCSYLIIGYGLLIAVCHILSDVLRVLPIYK